MKKKKIAVYDSTGDDLAVTAAAIREYYDRAGEKAEIAEFTDDYDFLCHFRDRHYDMAFLAMNSPLDLATARSAGAIDRNCPLFFVSNTADYGIEGLRLAAVDYLLKPVVYTRVQEALGRISIPPV